MAPALRGADNWYVSQSTFRGGRCTAALHTLGSCFSDVDYQKIDHLAGRSPDSVAILVLWALADAGIPSPSFILATGCGLQVIWLMNTTPRSALPRWQAVQKQILAVLKHLGADPCAIDAARVLRICGTRHSRAGTIVRPVWMDASVQEFDKRRWDFNALATEILPLTRAELAALRIRRAQKLPRNTSVRPAAARRTGETFWQTVYDDLTKFRYFRWNGVIPTGHRDSWLFIAGIALTWTLPLGAARTEIDMLGYEACGWDARSVKSCTASVFARAERAATGQQNDWKGRSVDFRYRYRVRRIIELLDIQASEMKGANLRVLIDADVKRQRDAQRKRDSRRASGTCSREIYEWESDSRQKPWSAAGISRATWHRRKRNGGETSLSRCMVAEPTFEPENPRAGT